MTDREKVEEWARDFKAYVDELDIARDDYRGIMEYIDDALALLREQEPVKPIAEGKRPYRWFRCGNCEEPLYGPWNYCPKCGRKVKWDG